jgi:hypothetical protein
VIIAPVVGGARGLAHWARSTFTPEVMPMGAIGEPKREIFIPVPDRPEEPAQLPMPDAPAPDLPVPALPRSGG